MSNEYKDIKEFESKSSRGQYPSGNHRPQLNNEAKMKLLGLIAAIVVILVIVILAVSGKDSDDKNKPTKEPTTKQQESSSKEETSDVEEVVPELVAESTDSEVYKLIMSYIDAAYIQCDATLLEGIVDSLENVQVDANSVRQRYIESYNDVVVYVLDGKDETNAVFVSYNVKLYNYEEMLPSGEMLKIKKSDDGVFKIHNIEVGEKFETHMTNEKQIEELGVIQEKIQSEYNAVIASNSEIKNIVDILNGANLQ